MSQTNQSGSGAAVANELRRLMEATIEAKSLPVEHLEVLQKQARWWAEVDASRLEIESGLRALDDWKKVHSSGAVDPASAVQELDIELSRILRSREQNQEAARWQAAVAGHLDDARRERTRARLCALGAVMSAAAAATSAWWGVSITGDAANVIRLSFLFPVVLSLGFLGAMFLLMLLAKQSVVASREQTRVARALANLPGYLDPFPELTQHLMRAKLAPLVFPRLLEDDDPLRNVSWPSDEDLLRTIAE